MVLDGGAAGCPHFPSPAQDPQKMQLCWAKPRWPEAHAQEPWAITHCSALCTVGKTTSHVGAGWTARILQQDCNFPTTKTLGQEEMRAWVTLAPSESTGWLWCVQDFLAWGSPKPCTNQAGNSSFHPKKIPGAQGSLLFPERPEKYNVVKTGTENTKTQIHEEAVVHYFILFPLKKEKQTGCFVFF